MTRTISIIPQPGKLEVGSGAFALTAETRIFASDASVPMGYYLARLLRPVIGFQLPGERTSTSPDTANAITLRLTPGSGKKRPAPESYALSVTDAGITIEAPRPAGLFYGVQTLRQFLPPAIESQTSPSGVAWTIPHVSIEDAPRYSWRGMHLDVSRHFFSVSFVKRYIDLLAMYKFNRFHWHLTDDQGWRIEIKSHPRLTEIGAWRTERDGTISGGFYTQDEIREVVDYAREHFITVVPEIEMPGHAQAALAAYPELACTSGPGEIAVWNRWGISKEVFCAGKEATFDLLEDVLAEVVALFPGPYVHVGGDECPKDRWSACDDCQARIQAEGLADENALQSYFIKRISRFLSKRNRQLIGWDEILEGGLAERAIVMSWRGTEGGIQAARAGHDVIMTPTSHCYFDYKHADRPDEPGQWGVIPLKKVYDYEPTPAELTPAEAQHVLGSQGNVWSESMPTTRDVEQMVFPRLCALAEVVWSPRGQRDWEDFKARLRAHGERLQALDVEYYRDQEIWPA
ncbi:MAG TPA: beta-N-acetylglucosaminidase [Chloroflexi bacterium]|nr:beta-N-acetylglucosaminidase [Chloroflexota bacterium]